MNEIEKTFYNMDDVKRRAFKAYFKRFGEYAAQPSSDVDFFEIAGKNYVVLSNVNGILAVYRIYNDGRLKFLKKYPKEISEQYQPIGKT